MPSGAGHDAMKLHEVMPQAMLFVRGQNSGISHNPLESPPATTCNSPSTPSPTCLKTGCRSLNPMNTYEQLDAWIDPTLTSRCCFLQELIRVPTDTPPGNNAPHAERTAELLQGMGIDGREAPRAAGRSQGCGHESVTNLVVRRKYGPGKTVLLNAHGDVVPPGEGWTKDPYGGEIENGKIYGRAAAVSKCDFSTYAFAVRALEAVAKPTVRQRGAAVHLRRRVRRRGGPGLAAQTQDHHPDLMIAAGFSYQVITAHNGCLQMEVTVHGKMAHAAIPDSGVDAMQAAVGDPERAVPTEHAVPADHIQGGGHQPSLPERRHD
jgi:succinyl-diaminopimelate desuccinylase